MISKEELHQKAEQLGVDISGLSWPNQINAVKEAEEKLIVENDLELKEEDERDKKIAMLEQQLEARNKDISEMRKKYENYEEGEIPDKSDYDEYPVMIAPEMSPHKTDPNLSRYSNEEKIGDGLIVEEVSYDIEDIKNSEEESLHGSYRIKGNSNKAVTAFSRGPRCQPGIFWWGTKNKNELFKEVTYNGNKAYLWSHVRAVIQSVNGGKYLKKYENEIKNNLISLGHRMCINKEATHNLLDAIEDEEKARKTRGY